MSQAQQVGWACAPVPQSPASGAARAVSADALASLLDVLPQPLLLIGRDQSVRHANRAAGELLQRGDGLLVRDGRLTAAGGAEASRLRRAIDELWAAGGDGRRAIQ
jgi:PAS domain-containing protein